jgi:uncharacterized protein (DUF2147 family)
MKRFAYLMALMALSSPACARDSLSFTIRGHDIHVEAARHCRSLSCISVSVGNRHTWHDRDEDEVATAREPAPAPLASQAQPLPAPVQAVPPATRGQAVLPAVTAPPALVPAQAPAPIQPPPVQVQTAPLPVQAQPSPLPALQLASAPPGQVAPPPPPASIEKVEAKPQDKPVAIQPAQVARVSQQTESDDADTPLGDWQTEGSGHNLVHIEACGAALCGYVLDAATHTKGESVLVNMKPKNDSEWTGSIYSRSSGNSYYGRMTLTAANKLRVEACALGSFFCSGNNWTRLDEPVSQDELMSSHQLLSQAHS